MGTEIKRRRLESSRGADLALPGLRALLSSRGVPEGRVPQARDPPQSRLPPSVGPVPRAVPQTRDCALDAAAGFWGDQGSPT